MNLSEKDSINDLLIQEKEMIKVYGTYLPEGSTSQLRNILKRIWMLLPSSNTRFLTL
jgi:spore coat protein CotF